jgi:hypothetical protein
MIIFGTAAIQHKLTILKRYFLEKREQDLDKTRLRLEIELKCEVVMWIFILEIKGWSKS